MSGVLLAATAVAAASSVVASSSGFVQTRFVIGGGPDPPCTQTSYANVRAVGCSFLHADSNEVHSVAGAQQMAKLCAANNLTCALPLVAIKEVAPDANVWGYFLHDEPRFKDFEGIAKSVASVRALRPTALSFVNLLGYGNFTGQENKNLYGTDTYDEYVDAFISTVKPDILSYDCYPNPIKSEMDLFHCEYLSPPSAASARTPAPATLRVAPCVLCPLLTLQCPLLTLILLQTIYN